MDPLIRGLLRADAYDHPVVEFETLETHISWVILTGEFAYKIKKPVNFGFVDFSTLELRKFYCEEELRLNRRMAEDLYLAVRPIFGPLPSASFQGAGEPLDYAVQMRQFSHTALLTEVLRRNELTPDRLDQFADDLARFQLTAPRAGLDLAYGSPTLVRTATRECLTPLQQIPEFAEVVNRLTPSIDAEEFRLLQEFENRKEAGKIREGHGDLHLGNMLLRNQKIEVFDCIEFNATLRWIDVLSDVAFLVMDLSALHRPDLGWRFLNKWLEQSGDYRGLRLFAWYFCYRALVRAKVGLLRRQQTDPGSLEFEELHREITAYLELAQKSLRPQSPALILACGPSGSGKSFWTQRLAADSQFISLRSDIERKRLFGQFGDPPQLTGDLYSKEASDQTYNKLQELAEILLKCGHSVIIDATFLSRGHRDQFLDLARGLGIPHLLIEFTASREILRRRILDRKRAGNDPSDADVNVLEIQLAQAEFPSSDEGWPGFKIDSELPDLYSPLMQSIRRILS